MSLALYRKYRPKTFAELVGQNHIKVTLQNEIATGQTTHAYLFCGPRGIGKTTVARLLAKSLNCLKRPAGENEPCNQCDACREINEGRSLDLIEIDAASQTQVENVRETIIEGSRLAPTSRQHKIFIIDEVHMLSEKAFNALLKTLEEPPSGVIFILATTEVYKLPVTIISRCQQFNFKKINLDDLTHRLKHLAREEKREVDEAVLTNIARRAEGCLRDAEGLLEQIFALNEKKITLEQADLILPRSDFKSVQELVGFLIDKNAGSALSLINRLMEEGVDLPQFTQDWLEFLRKMLLVKIGGLAGLAGDLDKDSEQKILGLADKVELPRLIMMIELVMAKKQELKFSPIIQLPLELAVVEICRLTGDKF